MTGSAGGRTAARLRDRLAARMSEGRTALVVYVTCGDPTPAAAVDIVAAAAAAGADVVELGVPFSDPSADGPVIQDAMQRALAAGGGLPATLDAVAAIRARGVDVPIVLFGYYNPIFVYGVDRFAAAAGAAGADAALTVDVPVDELAELAAPLAARGVGVIPLCAPTSGADRLARLAAFDPPFIYYISMTGITGAGFHGAEGGADRMRAIRDAAGAPVCVGFGIKTARDARQAAAGADGIVVGSAVVSHIADAAREAASVPSRDAGAAAARAVAAYVSELRTALDG